MKIKTFILTFLMMMSCPFLFGQSNVTPETYGSLKMALSGELGTNIIITLAGDINVTETIEIPTTVTATLDLNGCKLTTAEDKYAFNNMGKLTIKDAVGTGSIETRGIYNGNQGSVDETTLEAVLTIEGGIFKAIGTNGGAAIYNLGTTVIKGGEFYGYYAALHNRLAEMTIENAYIEAYDHNAFAAMRNSGNLTIGENVLLAGNYNHEGEATKTGDFKVVVAKINDKPYVQFTDVINDIKNVSGDVTVKLYQDVAMDITAWQTLAIGGDNTTKITIDGENGDNDFTLTFNKLNSDWNHIATSNDNATTLVLKNMTITDSGNNNGPWNRYDLVFASDVELHNVNATKALAFKADATLNNVNITENKDVYAIWIQPNGQEISIDGLVIESAGRGIKVDEQYVTAQDVTLSVANATFNTVKKAAILVKSAAETAINVGENVNIANVAADNVNIAWVATDAAVNYGNVTVTGGTLAQEDSDDFYAAHVDNEGNIVSYFKTLQDAVNAADGKTIVLVQDYTNDVTISQEEGKNIIIDGKDFNFSGTIYIDGNSRSEGEETLTIQNFNFTTEEAEHNFIASDFRLTDDKADDPVIRYAHNVTVKDCNFTATEESTAVVGMRFRQAYNIKIEGGKFANLHSVMWTTGTSGAAVKGILATGCKEGGISFGTSTGLSVESSTIVATTGYGIRVGGNSGESLGGPLTITKSNITAKIPVLVRNANNDSKVTFVGENTITELNSNNAYYCVIGAGEYDGGTNLPEAATGNVIVDLTESNLSYEGVYGNFAVAKIGNVQYSTFAAALEAAQNNDKIELIYKEGDAPIAMNGAVYGKNVTVTGTATVDWSKGWFFIGRGGEGDAEVTFENANLTSASNTTKYGINVSGKAADGHAYDGTLILRNSNIEVDYIITRKETKLLSSSTLTVKNGFVVGGRPAEETVNGKDATAKVQLFTNSHIVVNNRKSTIGFEGIGELNLDAGTSFTCNNHDLTITEKGRVNVTNAKVNASANIANAGTVYVKNSSDIAANEVTGAGWFYMDNVNMTSATKLDGAKVRFAKGTNNINGSFINNGSFQVGVGAYNGVDANVDTQNGVIVNVKNAVVGAKGDTYAGWAGTGFYDTDVEKAAVMTDAKYVLNIENSIAEFGYLHVSNDGELNVKGNAAEKKWYNNSDYSFYAGDFIINGTATFDATDVLALYTKVSCDNGTDNPGTLNINEGTYFEAERHNGAIAGTNFILYKTGIAYVAKGAELHVGEPASIAENAILNIGGTATVLGTVTNNGTINLTDLEATLTTPEAPVVETTIPYHKVSYNNGVYSVVAKDYVAQIIDAEGNSSLDRRYESFAEAVQNAQNGETIELLWEEGDNAIAMAAALNGKTITVTGNAYVDWSKGFLFVGRGDAQGNNADATLIFDEANITSKPADNNGFGLNVSGYEIDGETINRTGKVIMNNSNIEVEYLLNVGNIELNNTTLRVNDGFRISGRTAAETQGTIGTAKIDLVNSTVIVDNMNGMPIGYKGIGIMNIDENSTLQCLRDYGVAFNGTMNIAGSVVIADGKKLTNNGEMNINGGNVSVTSIDNAGTINVTAASVLNATVTGDGSVNMNNATLAETTNLNAVAVVFDGENNINGATIETTGKATVVTGKLAVNEGSKVKFNSLEVNKQLSVTKGQLRVTTDFVNNGITSFNYEESDVYVYGATTNNNVLNISNKAVYKTGKFENNSENLNVSANSKLQVNGAATFVENSISKIAGEVSVVGSVTQAENADIRLTEAAARFTTNAKLNVVTTVADSKVSYEDGAYVVVAKQYLAKIGDNQYETLQDAFDAAETGATIVLFNDKVSVIPMNASLYGKDVTITTNGEEVTVDWNTNGNYWLFVGRGGEGNATLTFDKAIIKSVSNNGGIHVSGREKETTTKYDGTLIIKNSEIELTEFINRNVVEVENSTINTSYLTSGGRAAGETVEGNVATAKLTLTNSVLNAVLDITIGYEGIGTMTVDAESNVVVERNLYVDVEGSKLFSAGDITGNLKEEVEDAIELTAGVYTVDVREYCAEGYGAFYNDEYKTWTVRMTYGVQETSLAKGWNWFSSYINLSTNDGLEKIQTALGTSGIEIKGKYNNNMSECEDLGDGTYAWFGDFTPSAEQMYMINTSDAVTMNIEGDVVDYTNVAIVLNSGWNWIGYPLYETVEINDALANLTNVASGDEIKSLNNGYAQYSARLKKWSGTLSTLTPGEGYMYKSSNATSFVYSVGSKRSSDNNVNVVENYYWTPNVSEYSNNMTITAMLSIDNELVNDNYEIAAFANGECRGNARPVYIDELDSYVLFMNIRGNDVEELTFKYYDVNYGTEYVLDNRINYSNDAVVGTIDEPYMFNLSILNVDEATISEVNIYPNPTTTGIEINLNATCDKVEVFNALGVKVAEYQNVDSIDAIETAGIYVIRITNDSNVQNCRLVVK